jgi:hypothetical protein
MQMVTPGAYARCILPYLIEADKNNRNLLRHRATNYDYSLIEQVG